MHACGHAGEWVGDEQHGDGAETQASDPEQRIQAEDGGGDGGDAQDDYTGGGPEVSFQGVETEVEYRGGNQSTEDGYAKSTDELLGAGVFEHHGKDCGGRHATEDHGQCQGGHRRAGGIFCSHRSDIDVVDVLPTFCHAGPHLLEKLDVGGACAACCHNGDPFGACGDGADCVPILMLCVAWSVVVDP